MYIFKLILSIDGNCKWIKNFDMGNIKYFSNFQRFTLWIIAGIISCSKLHENVLMTAAHTDDTCVSIFLKTNGPQYLICITSACHWLDRFYTFWTVWTPPTRNGHWAHGGHSHVFVRCTIVWDNVIINFRIILFKQ